MRASLAGVALLAALVLPAVASGVHTRVDRRHPDLVGALVAEHCFVPPSGCPDGTAEQDGPGSAMDNNGHGTNVAGIIVSAGAFAPIGVAPAAQLVVVKVLDAENRFETS